MLNRKANRRGRTTRVNRSSVNAGVPSNAVGQMSSSLEGSSQEHLLRALISCVPDYLFAKDTKSRFIFANPPMAEDLGLTVNDLIGKTDFDLHPRELAEKFFADEQSVISSGKPIIDIEEFVVTTSGQKKWFATFKSPLRSSGGQLIGVFGTCHDITELKSAEATLIASEAQLSNALKMARAGHWIYDVARDEFTFNDNFYALLRTSAAEVGGYVMRSADYAKRFCHPDDVAHCRPRSCRGNQHE